MSEKEWIFSYMTGHNLVCHTVLPEKKDDEAESLVTEETLDGLERKI